MLRLFKYVASMIVGISLLYVAVRIRAVGSQVPSGTWAPAGNLAQARSGASSALLSDGRILVTGGDGGSGPVASVEMFGADGSLSFAPSMTFARSHHASVVLKDGRTLVTGGIGADGRPTDTAEIFDPTTNSWTRAGLMMVPRGGHTSSLLQDGRVLITGGVSAGGPTNTLEIYDPTSNTFSLGSGVGFGGWSPQRPLPQPAEACSQLKPPHLTYALQLPRGYNQPFKFHAPAAIAFG